MSCELSIVILAFNERGVLPSALKILKTGQH